MKKCKFCGNNYEKLVDAHIIPRAFFEYSKDHTALSWGDNRMKMFTNSHKTFPQKKVPIGWYDQELLCEKCEKIFGPFDDYAIKLLLKDEKLHVPLILKGAMIGWQVNDYDYNKLKCFFVSLLWRAGCSNLFQFSKIDLAEKSNRAKALILSESVDEDTYFSFVLARFSDDYGLSFMADPHPESSNDTFGDVQAYRFYLGAGYVVYIKADQKLFSSHAKEICAAPHKPLMIVRRGDFITSKEFKSFKVVLEEADKRIEDIKSGHILKLK